METKLSSKGLTRQLRNLSELIKELQSDTGAVTLVLGDTVSKKFETKITGQNIGATAVGGNVSSVSLNQTAAASGDGVSDELVGLLARLSAEAAALRGNAPDETVDAAADAASEISADIADSAPQEEIGRKLRNFLGLAKAAGVAGSALAAAILAVREAIGLG